jgi:hypothetical protein
MRNIEEINQKEERNYETGRDQGNRATAQHQGEQVEKG